MPSFALRVEPQGQHYSLPPRAPALVPLAPPVYENRLLNALPRQVLDRIAPHLERSEVEQGTILYDAGSQVRSLYFPVDSIVAMLYVMENGDSAQTVMVGCEGIVGFSSLMGCQTSPSSAVMQTSGALLKLRASLLAQEFERNPQATQLLLRYTQSLFIQLAQSAVCNRHHSLENQLCRWLLTTLDRQHGSELFMTQELIATMIGARREGVTGAAGNLQRLGIINYSRGHITVVDRPALERRACECYATVKRQTDHLMAPALAN
jgi:CRP-like cAMP-binding protein